MALNIKRLLEPAIENKKEFFMTLFTWTMISMFTIANILLIQKIVAIVESENLDNAWSVAIIFAVLNLTFMLFVYFTRNFRWIRIDNAVQINVQRKYMKMFNNFDNTAIEAYGTGKIISIVNKGISYWPTFIVEGSYSICSFMVSFIAMIVVIGYIGTIYNILVLIIMLILANIAALFFTKKSIPYRKEIIEKRILYDRQFTKMVMSKFEILQNGKINREIGILDDLYFSMTKLREKLFRFVIGIAIVPDLLVFIIYFAFLILLIYAKVPFSIVVSFFMLITYFNSMLKNLLWFYDYYTREFYNVEKLWDFFDTTPKIKGLNSGKNFKYKNGDIEVTNINFQYGDKIVFDDLSLKIQGEKVTALVGESGSGKTTLIKLLSGFIEPTLGDILIDGQKLNDINLMSYYKDIGYLTQDPSVFDGTIIDNLTYGIKGKVGENNIKKVIKKAKCEFVYEFDEGLNTEIGERGVRLSGGQKQRLAIAKIFLKDPKIVFLDEPTSALDSFSEELIQESFRELFKGRTVIIIAHRLQTVKNADEIIVMGAGKVIERGNHKSLIKKDGPYKMMLDLQSGF